MNIDQLNRMQNDQGFIAALDQSGGSTPKSLAAYGISQDTYHGEDEMFDLVHQMRSRIIASPVFDGEHILAVILFKQTMERQIEGIDTADYLWQRKSIVPFLKVDNGLVDQADGVQLMKPIPELASLLEEAKSKHVFGTKMRSFIKEYNETGLRQIVDQQFALADEITVAGLLPIIEPEVDINAAGRSEIEARLQDMLITNLDRLHDDQKVMLKLSLPEQDDFYKPLIAHPKVVRVVALSGGYDRDTANARLVRNHGLIASFSRALLEGLQVNQSQDEFDEILRSSIYSIYRASIT